MKKLILIILLISSSLSLNADIINDFLCSDDPKAMAEMVEYPFGRISDKSDFIKHVKEVQTQQGPYKIGKSCEGFTWNVSGNQARSSDGKVVVEFYIGDSGKIANIKGRRIDER